MAWNRETQDLMAVIMPSTLSASKIPAEASGSWIVDDFAGMKGVRVTVLTQAQAMERQIQQTGRCGWMSMRVLATCACGKTVAASRLGQHRRLTRGHP